MAWTALIGEGPARESSWKFLVHFLVHGQEGPLEEGRPWQMLLLPAATGAAPVRHRPAGVHPGPGHRTGRRRAGRRGDW